MRLASLYVDPNAELTDLPPSDMVQPEDAEKALGLARARLDHERARGIRTGEADELTEWFLDTMADPERSRIMLSPPFIAKYEELNGEPREWVRGVREDMERQDREMRALAEEELNRPAAAKGAEKPRWRANMTVYTPSHSVRAKVLTRWNERFDQVHRPPRLVADHGGGRCHQAGRAEPRHAGPGFSLFCFVECGRPDRLLGIRSRTQGPHL